MPTIHRSYEVLIEETVTTEDRQRRKHGTNKKPRFNAKTTAALDLTNEIFQDAVCYYTLMLAGMVKDSRWTEETLGYAQWMKSMLNAEGWEAKKRQLLGKPINPLWYHITKSSEMCAVTTNVVKRLAENYPHAIFQGAKDADDLVQKAFCYQGGDCLTDGSRREKRRERAPAQSVLVKTFVQKLMAEAVKAGGNADALNNMASFAGVWSGHLCNPAGRSRPKGTGVYERLHAELWQLVDQSESGRRWAESEQALAVAIQAKDSSDNRKRLRTAVKNARISLLNDSSLREKVCERVQQLAESRAGENAAADADELRIEIAKALKSSDRKASESDDAIQKMVSAEFDRKAKSAREVTLRAFRRAFDQPSHAAELKLAPYLSVLRQEIASAQSDDKRLRRLQERGKKDAGEFMEILYRLLWVLSCADMRDDAASDVLAFVIDNEPPESTDDKLPYQDSAGEPLFPFFTNSLGLPVPNQVVWDTFDTAAFKRAAEDVFKYAIRVAERLCKIDGLRTDKEFFDGKGRLSDKKNKDGTPRYIFFGMEGDNERRKQIEEVIRDLGKDRASGASGYGLRSGTIGGWAYLRPELLKVCDRQNTLCQRLAKCDKLTPEVENKLEDHYEAKLLAVVEKARSKSGGGFGSADFFYALCREENRILWLEDWENRKEQDWHAPDFVAYYVRYSQKMEDLRNIAEENEDWKPKPINYTWPGQKHLRKRERSLRPFDFKCDIRAQPQIDLFAKDESSAHIRRVTTNKADKDRTSEFPLTLSFRRLKRDRITDAAGNSVEAFFAPPKLAVKDAPPAPILAGPRVRPDDIKKKELGAFLEDFAKKPNIARLLQGVENELAQHYQEIQRLAGESTNSKKAEDTLRKQRGSTVAVLCSELNRLISSDTQLYRVDDLSSRERRRIETEPVGLEHRIQNRKAIQKILGSFLKEMPSCYKEAVSLLAPKRAGGAFHFMFAVELDDADLKAFRVPTVPGEQPFRRTKQGETWVAANLRWPVDLQTETAERKRKEEKTKEAGEDISSVEDADAKKPPVLPERDGLWCAPQNLKVDIHALFVDLGVRFAGAWSRARLCRADGIKPDTAHVISPPECHSDYQGEIWCDFYDEGTFRLQGEDAKVWHRPKGGSHDKEDNRFLRQQVLKLDEGGRPQRPDANSGKDGWRYGRELYGSRGRLATPEEIKWVFGQSDKPEEKGLAERLFPSTNRFPLPAKNSDAIRFIPAMAEHLVARLDRRLGRINFLFNLRWRLEGTMEQDPTTRQFTRPRDNDVDQPKHYRVVVESLAPAALRPQSEDAEDIGWNDELRSKLTQNWAGLDGLLEKPKRRKQREKHNQEWEKRIAADPRWQWKQLADATHTQLKLLLDELGVVGETGLIAQVARFVWPLRDKRWHWRKHTVLGNGDICPSLLNTELLPTGSAKRKIIGQGGLNMQRIELLQHFRRCCQSLAKYEERFAHGRIPGQRGLEPYIVPRGESVHDPCPSFLKKINELRDQRVDQTAALILAEALGLELMNPADVSLDGLRKWQLKSERDVHGRYQRRKLTLDGKKIEAPQCSLIVVEDLSRYLTSLDRSRFENRRLMEWSHRQVIKKLKDMAQVFGIEIMAVDARYSSRFCSKTHVPGVRVAEVKRGFEKEHPWRKWRDEKFNGKLTKRAERVQEVAALFAKETNQEYQNTLLIEMDGGPGFISANGVFHNNADINASKNIGFRGIAHPDLWEFFPVVRTETATDGKLRIINRRGTLTALKKSDDAKREFSPVVPKKKAKSKKAGLSEAAGNNDESETSERPYLFVSGPPMGRALPLDDDEDVFVVASAYDSKQKLGYRTARGGLFWKLVADACRKHIDQLNTQRLSKPKSP